MQFHFEPIIQPILTLLQPATIVEIGSETGGSTNQLLQFCRQNGAVLHAIDPVPLFDPVALQRAHSGHFIFHQALSLKALPTIPEYDVVLIDGDHNWYTVFNELKQVEQKSLETSRPFPFVMLHDVGWPYGRRDLYYNPDTIPVKHRQPHTKKGMRPGVPRLQQQGGKNASLNNAIEENTPHNGVLTAVEDFLKETRYHLELMLIPGLHDLALLFRTELKTQNFSLAQFLDIWNMHPALLQYVQRLEAARIAIDVAAGDREFVYEQAKAARKQQLEQVGAKIEQIQADMQTRVFALNDQLVATRSELAACRKKLALQDFTGSK